MSDALLGVLAGGGIALAAQVIAAWFTARAAHNRWLREQRVPAYAELLQLWRDHYEGLSDHHCPSDGSRPYEDGREPDGTDLLSLYHGTVKVSLIASDPVGQKAWAAYQSLMDVIKGRDDAAIAGLNRAKSVGYELHEAMRRDLGTGRDEMRPPGDRD